MSDKKNFFPEEIELSGIVLTKTNQAFEQIKQEDTDSMKRQKNSKKIMFQPKVAAIAGVCILAAGSMSAAAAIHHYWGRGMNGNLQASERQQQELTDSGVAKVYQEDPDYSSLAVTDHGITITPDTVIVDERFAYISFHISGYSVTEGEEPGFEIVNVYQENYPDDSFSLNMSGHMYDGVIPDENGTPIYDDGSSLDYYEDGSIVSHYTDSNGDMEYIIQAGIVNKDDTLLGKTLHVNFQNLGTLSKAAFASSVDGNWDFVINLSNVSSAKNIPVGQKVDGTSFVIDDINLSPISMRVNYTVSETPDIKDDDLGIPEVKGVVLKDGTRIPYLTDGSRSGYTDSSMTSAYQIAGYDRVIDVDQIEAFIVLIASDKDTVEIPISK